MRQLCSVHHLQDGDGQLDFDEVSRAVTLSFPALVAGLSGDSGDSHPEILRRAFRAADNGDGAVSRREFRLLLEYIAYFKHLREKFDKIDANGDHALSPPEFIKGAQTLGLRT